MTDSMNCKYCREDLSGKKYVKQEEKPVCVRCHDQVCANTCSECRRPIGIDSKELQHKGRYWHADCFRCYKSLAKESFSAKDDGIICGKCSSRENAPRCHTCYKAILAGSDNVEYEGDVWHEVCFTCFHCKKPIHSQSFLTKGTDIYCNRCHEKKFAKICVSCKQVLTTGGVNYQEQPWHSECFKAFCVDWYKTTVAKRIISTNNYFHKALRRTLVFFCHHDSCNYIALSYIGLSIYYCIFYKTQHEIQMLISAPWTAA
uniref:Four and a half LIM domains 1b n=1 Tax=Salmo trutta TaxID=8032 RepID=A0A673YDB2_SALTR